MGSCVSAQGEEGRRKSKSAKNVKANHHSPDRSRTHSCDLEHKTTLEKIEHNEKIKEKLEEEKKSLQQELEGTTDEQNRQLLHRRINEKRKSLKGVECTIEMWNKVLEKETDDEIQNSIQMSQRIAPMVNHATRQTETLQRRISNTAF